jgi:hypothetical protein
MAGKGWKALKGLFVEVQDDPTPPVNDKVSQKVPESLKSAPVSVIPVDVESGKADSSIMDNLAVALEKANVDGFDYFEFAKILNSLAASLPSEQLRYQTAFASAAALKATKQTILDTADHYISILNSEAEGFAMMVAEQTKNTVTSKEEAAASIDATITEKAQLVSQLTQEINDLTNNKTAVLNEAGENKLKIMRIQNDFAASLKIFLDRITVDKAKISQYVPG